MEASLLLGAHVLGKCSQELSQDIKLQMTVHKFDDSAKKAFFLTASCFVYLHIILYSKFFVL